MTHSIKLKEFFFCFFFINNSIFNLFSRSFKIIEWQTKQFSSSDNPECVSNRERAREKEGKKNCVKNNINSTFMFVLRYNNCVKHDSNGRDVWQTERNKKNWENLNVKHHVMWWE